MAGAFESPAWRSQVSMSTSSISSSAAVFSIGGEVLATLIASVLLTDVPESGIWLSTMSSSSRSKLDDGHGVAGSLVNFGLASSIVWQDTVEM